MMIPSYNSASDDDDEGDYDMPAVINNSNINNDRRNQQQHYQNEVNPTTTETEVYHYPTTNNSTAYNTDHIMMNDIYLHDDNDDDDGVEFAMDREDIHGRTTTHDDDDHIHNDNLHEESEDEDESEDDEDEPLGLPRILIGGTQHRHRHHRNRQQQQQHEEHEQVVNARNIASYALLAIQLIPPPQRCGLFHRLTASITLEGSRPICKNFTLSPSLLKFHFNYSSFFSSSSTTTTSSPSTTSSGAGISIFDIAEYYGPQVLTIKIYQDTFITRKELFTYRLSLHEIVRLQEQQNLSSKAESCFWGANVLVPLPSRHKSSTLPYFDICLRYVEVKHCLKSPLISSRDGLQRTELQHAAAIGSGKFIAKLLFTLARFSCLREALALRYRHKYTALDCALLNGNLETCRELLSRCGSLCFQNTQPHTACALHHAVRGGSYKCLRVLLRFLERYGTAVIIGWDGTFPELIEWIDEDGYSPLHLACSMGNAEMVRKLLQQGVQVDRICSKTGKTALMLAAEGGHIRPMGYLLSIYEINMNDVPRVSTRRGERESIKSMHFVCSPDVQDAEGRTAMMLAAGNEHAQAVLYLLRRGASYTLVDKEGNSLLHEVARTGCVEVCRVLVKQEQTAYQANIQARRRTKYLTTPLRRRVLCMRNNMGKSPLDIAEQAQRADIVALLTQAITMYGTQQQQQQELSKSLSSAQTQSPKKQQCSSVQGSDDNVDEDEEGASTEKQEQQWREQDAAEALNYNFAMLRPLRLSLGYSPQGYYSMVPAAPPLSSSSPLSAAAVGPTPGQQDEGERAAHKEEGEEEEEEEEARNV